MLLLVCPRMLTHGDPQSLLAPCPHTTPPYCAEHDILYPEWDKGSSPDAQASPWTRVGVKCWFRFRLPLIISLLTLLHKSVLEARRGCPSVPRVLPLSDAVLQDPLTESRAVREVCGLY